MTCWLSGFETSELSTNAKTAVTCKNGPCQSCIAVAKVNGEINQAVTTLRRLLAKRCDLLSEHNRTHDFVQRLPVELTNHIFEHLLPLRNKWGEIPDTGTGVMPSYLASICRGWRDIAWSNPVLWSTMHMEIIPPSNSRFDPPGGNNFAHEWFLRSQTLPLTIHVVIRTTGILEWSKQALYPVLDAMNQCSDRLQSLSLDIPHPILEAIQRTDFQWHRLTRLRILFPPRWRDEISQPLPLLNPTASPEKLEIHHESLMSLQISWNHLTSAKIEGCNLEDLAKLFQYASQLIDCRIKLLNSRPENFSMPPIIHHSLKKLGLYPAAWGVGHILLDSLTLPCLQEFRTDETVLLLHLPALMHRSSCPLTRLALYHNCEDEKELFDHLQPLPGVTDLILKDCSSNGPAVYQKLLFEEYFPNLRRLTLRLPAFVTLWNSGIISLLLGRKRPRPDGLNEGRLDKFIVVDKTGGLATNRLLDSVHGEQMKALGITLTEDGFEFF